MAGTAVWTGEEERRGSGERGGGGERGVGCSGGGGSDGGCGVGVMFSFFPLWFFDGIMVGFFWGPGVLFESAVSIPCDLSKIYIAD